MLLEEGRYGFPAPWGEKSLPSGTCHQKITTWELLQSLGAQMGTSHPLLTFLMGLREKRECNQPYYTKFWEAVWWAALSSWSATSGYLHWTRHCSEQDVAIPPVPGYLRDNEPRRATDYCVAAQCGNGV